MIEYPPHVWLLTQRLDVEVVNELTCPEGGDTGHPPKAEGEEHTHRAYGVYDAASQLIQIDSSLRFDHGRETFLHENLHAMISMTQIDSLLDAQMQGFDEHLVSVLAPVMLAWLRDNPRAVAFLQERQPCASI